MKIKQIDLWLQRFRNRGSEGFSIIEIALVIPLVAVTGGFIILLLTQSIQTAQDAAAMTSASTAVNTVSKDVEQAYNCYDLEQKAGSLVEFDQAEGRKNIVVRTIVTGNCAAGGESRVEFRGTEKGDSRILYRKYITVLMAE